MPTPPPTIRPLAPNDAPAYAALRREMLADSPWAFMSSLADDRGVNEAEMRASLAREGFAVLGAFDAANRLIAVAGINRESKSKRAHVAGIWGVYVTPSARGGGLSRAVIQAAIAAARAWPGVHALALSVSENSPAAQRVYTSLGFVSWGTEPDALRVGDRSYAELHMRLSLDHP